MRPTTAQGIAVALGGHCTGNSWMARCPAHDDSTPSLSVKETGDGTLLVHCHAGCKQSTVIAALTAQGLWRAALTGTGAPATMHSVSDGGGSKIRTAKALQLWCSAVTPEGTLVHSYLCARGIHVPVPRAIRHHVGLKHRSGGFWPAMISLVTRGDDNRPIGIHRTFLSRDGRGKAPVDPNKMMLGPCRGGAVRLAPAGAPLMIGEGIETCLAVMQATGYAAWAALSTSGMRRLALPTHVRDIIVLADGDAPGEAAAIAAAARWRQEGRRVRIARAPVGADFNDLLLTRPSSITETTP